jgi:hypothetical protein
LKPGAWVEPQKMLDAIRDSGFTPVPEEIRLTVTGTLDLRHDRFVLVLDRMKNAKELRLSPGQAGDALKRALSESTPHAVAIQGRWLSEPDTDLLVEKIETPTGAATKQGRPVRGPQPGVQHHRRRLSSISPAPSRESAAL